MAGTYKKSLTSLRMIFKPGTNLKYSESINQFKIWGKEFEREQPVQRPSGDKHFGIFEELIVGCREYNILELSKKQKNS